VAAVIGNPVRHSLSPLLHNAAFAAAGLDWTYVAFEPAPSEGAAAVAAMRHLGLAGLSVTMPFKEQALRAVDHCAPWVATLGAVNCVRWDGDDLVGENTDGEGFVRALREEAGLVPQGRRCVVFGAGGASRAVVTALAAAGAERVAVVNRSAARAVEAAGLAGDVGATASPDEVADADLVVNATPLGMGPGDELPFDPDLIHTGHVVVDLVYHPAETPLLAMARQRGAVTLNGLGMLVHQAGLAFTHWTGLEAPLRVMRAAVVEHLG
jgi:shikimate dehydrogenase